MSRKNTFDLTELIVGPVPPCEVLLDTTINIRRAVGDVFLREATCYSQN